MKIALYSLFALAWLLGLLLGGETRSVLFWPGALLLGAACVLSVVRIGKAGRFAPADWYPLVFFLAWGYAVARAYLSPLPFLAREDLTLLGSAACVYGFIVFTGDHPKWRVGFVWLALAVAVANLLVAFVQKTGNPIYHPLPWYEQPSYAGRVGGLFSNPNHLGAFLGAVNFVLLGLVCFGRGGTVRRLLLIYAILMLAIGMVLTQSRGALFGGAVGLVIFLLLGVILLRAMHPHHFWKVIAVGGGVFAILGALVLFLSRGLVESRIQEWRGGNIEDVRRPIWETALAQHESSPVWGTGARTFTEYERKFRSPGFDIHAGDAQFVHNEFLQVLADYGYVGLGLLILVLVIHFAGGIRYLNWYVTEKFPTSGATTGNSLGLVVGGLAAAVALLVQAVAEFHFHTPAIVMFFAFLMAILASPGYETMGNLPYHGKLWHYLVRFLTVVIGGAFLVFAVHYGRADFAFEQGRLSGDAVTQANRRIESFQKAGELDPTHYLAWYQAGASWLSKYGWEKEEKAKRAALASAVECFEKALVGNPTHAESLTNLVDLYFLAGRQEEARQAVALLLETSPFDRSAWASLAILELRSGNYLAAEKACLRMREVNNLTVSEENFWRLYHTILNAQARSVGLEVSPGLRPSE